MKFSTILTTDQRKVLSALQDRDRHERQSQSSDPLRLKAVTQTVAQFLHLTILQKSARTIVEFGTSHGYSTIYLAAAAVQTGGCVLSVDQMPEKTKFASENLRAAGLDHIVELHTTDGTDFARLLPTAIDFVFVDYGIPAFAPAFEILKTKLSLGGFLFVDGWSRPECWETEVEWRSFKEHLEKEPTFLSCTFPLEKEHLIAVKLGDSRSITKNLGALGNASA